MATTPSSRLRLPLQETGDNTNAWGNVLNGLFRLVDDSQGVSVVTVNGDVTLSNENYVTNQARAAVIKTAGTGLSGNMAALVTIPLIDKWRIIHNVCSGDIRVGTGSDDTVTIRAGQMSLVYCDGSKTFVADPTLDKVARPTGPVDGNSQQFKNTADGTDPGDLVTKRQHTQWLNDIAGNAASASSSASAAAASAAAANSSAQTAAANATQTNQDRQAVAAALGSIANGPVYNVNGKTGNVTLTAADVGASTADDDFLNSIIFGA